MSNIALPINASSGTPAYSAQQFRQATSALMSNGTSRVLGSRSGYCPGRQAATLTVTSTTWTIGPFSAVIDPAFTTDQGPYLCATNANNTNTNVSAADATNARIDILYAQVSDTDIDSSGSRVLTVAYLAGTAAASPSPPSTPARSFVLATINVPHSGAGSPTITANNTFMVAAGGVVPVSGSSAYPTAPTEGMVVDDATLDALFRYNGTNWVPINGSFTTSTGSLVTGTYDATKPRREYFRRQSGTSDASGFITVALVNTAILGVGLQPEIGSAGSATALHIRNDATTSTNVVLQMRSLSTGSAQASTAYVISGPIFYQN